MRRTHMNALAEPTTRSDHPRALALSDFLDTEYRRVVGSVALITGDRGSAEDAVNDALVAAWDRREQPIDRLGAWITVAASNNARSLQRRRSAERRAVDRLDRQVSDETAEPALFDDALVRAMETLSPREREVAVLHYVLDLSVDDTAAELDVTSGTVKTLLSRARTRLADALTNEGDDRA